MSTKAAEGASVLESDPVLRDDMIAARQIARRFLKSQREHPLWLRAQARANRALALEWALLIAVTYLLVYAPLPSRLLPLKIVLLIPWALYSSLALDVDIHYYNHWPLFARVGMNRLVRLSGVLVFASPLEISHHHWQHHRYNDPYDDPQTALTAIAREPGARSWLALGKYLGKETLRSVWGFLPWTETPDYIQALRRSRPAEHREITFNRWANLAWLIVLLILDWKDTALLLVPATLLLAPLASFVMNLTDHAPSDLTHPFRQATYLEPRTRMERALSFVNHYTAATHLTHHLFPHVHWCHIRRLQRRLLRVYARWGAPRSMIVGSVLLGNPFGFLKVLRDLRRQRAVREVWPGAGDRPGVGALLEEA
jgi:fatty acid desaturase